MATDRMIDKDQGDTIIAKLDLIASKVQGINRDTIITSEQVTGMVGYQQDSPAQTNSILTTDSLNAAIRKLETGVETNGTNISSLQSNKIGASDYASQNTGGTVRIWTTTSGSDTILHIANEAPTP